MSAAAAAHVVHAANAAVAAAAANRFQPMTAKKSTVNNNLLQLQLVNENGSITPIEVVTSMAAAMAAHHVKQQQQQQLELEGEASTESENDEVSTQIIESESHQYFIRHEH
jgi:hypothetical protein